MIPADIKVARKRLGMTRTQLGRALKLERSDPARTVRTWEQNARPIRGPVEVAVEFLVKQAEPQDLMRERRV
jgi:DNA-binding transcriptional regulator YiaG